MYDDILGNKKEKISLIDVNDLLKNDKRIKEIKQRKYNSSNTWAIIIDNDKIEREDLIEIRDKIINNTNIKKEEIIFIVKNIIIQL